MNLKKESFLIFETGGSACFERIKVATGESVEFQKKKIFVN